jgi:hypothetical protein
MTTYYDILDKFKELCEADIDINTVTQGSIDKVINNKQTMYSAAHIMINNVGQPRVTHEYNVTVLFFDVVDETKVTTTDIFKGNDNMVDVHNTTLAIATRVVEQFRRGDPSTDGYVLSGTPSHEPFHDRFTDKVAGWATTMTVKIVHGMTIC